MDDIFQAVLALLMEYPNRNVSSNYQDSQG